MAEHRDSKGRFIRGNVPWNKRGDSTQRGMTSLVPKMIGGGVLKLERVQVICPACGQQVEAIATNGRVKGYCAVAKQYVDFLVEAHTNKEHTAETRAKMSALTHMIKGRHSRGRSIVRPSGYSRDELDELYWKYGLDLREIASRLGCSYTVIRGSFIKLGIPRRSKLEGLRLQWGKRDGKLPCSRGELYRLYWEYGLTLTQIASRLDKPYTAIRDVFIKLGIPRRSMSEALRLARRGRELPRDRKGAIGRKREPNYWRSYPDLRG